MALTNAKLTARTSRLMCAKVEEAKDKESALVDHNPAVMKTRSTYRAVKFVAIVVAMAQERDIVSQPAGIWSADYRYDAYPNETSPEMMMPR